MLVRPDATKPPIRLNGRRESLLQAAAPGAIMAVVACPGKVDPGFPIRTCAKIHIRRRRMSLTGDTDPSESRGMDRGSASAIPARVTFTRRELDRILNLYGRMVAAGEWRDYAIDFLKDKAVFSVFRRASEVPIYRIEKNPKLARRQGAYSVISATGHIVRRGQELDRVLGALDRSLRVVAG